MGETMIEQTLVILKPDAVQRAITGEILKRFERVGLKIVGMKMLFATKEQVAEHYYKDDEWLVRVGKGVVKNKGYPEDYDPKKAGQEIVDSLMNDMRLCPVVAMVLEGHNAINVVRKLCGPTNVEEALPGTIRGDYSHDTYVLANIKERPILTIIHASGDIDDAKKEVGIWFSPEEVHTYSKLDTDWHYRKGSLEA